MKDRLEGSLDFLEGQQEDDDDDDDDEDDGDGGDDKPKKAKKITNKMEDQEEEFDRMLREMDIKLDKESKDKVEVVGEPPLPPPDGEPPYDRPEHHSVGKPGDGIIYLSDIGEHVRKLNKRGRPYRVGPMVAKKFEGHQGQRAATVLKNGELCPPRGGMSSFVVASWKPRPRNSRRSG